MQNPRRYGSAPYAIAVIHGGPGAAGSMAPVARELSAQWGILEPLQTADTLEGQIQELRMQLEGNAALPVILIGWSWGAMLSFIFAARYPDLVKKLILIGSGGYRDEDGAAVTHTRLSRLDEAGKLELEALTHTLQTAENKDAAMASLGQFFKTKTDSYRPLPDDEAVEVRYDIHMKVWDGARQLRASGELLALGPRIKCPVVTIHGTYDPHPAQAVQDELAAMLTDFRFILLDKCGHTPWIEAEARDAFFTVLKHELICEH
jgi:pimeloyl-ACP methyl ester carboxylesterase